MGPCSSHIWINKVCLELYLTLHSNVSDSQWKEKLYIKSLDCSLRVMGYSIVGVMHQKPSLKAEIDLSEAGRQIDGAQNVFFV